MTTNEIKELISRVRADYKNLYDKHILSVQTGGTEGFKCLNPDVLEHLVNRTDKEILEDLIKKGAVIDGVEEYLAQLDP